ncbi:MAG: hypothetical protein CVV27_17415 [Candidatus Melainabacteria bacterium HGW-Melainabacteria-1]|nr:MAG: hypothetical protein CVV27_17415 [Candidatus Melainabacteria bacterium HGW-Melainabacteria-1]
MTTTAGWLSAAWGVGGFVLLLGEALYKLIPIALETFSHSLNALHWIILVLWIAFMAYSEGYKGFQKGYSPRLAARASWLRQHPSPRRSLLAPLFCMGFFETTRKRKIVAYALTCGIVVLVLSVRIMPQPWRGIADAGVVVGLSWGLMSVLYFTWQALILNRRVSDPEVVVS